MITNTISRYRLSFLFQDDSFIKLLMLNECTLQKIHQLPGCLVDKKEHILFRLQIFINIIVYILYTEQNHIYDVYIYITHPSSSSTPTKKNHNCRPDTRAPNVCSGHVEAYRKWECVRRVPYLKKSLQQLPAVGESENLWPNYSRFAGNTCKLK